MYNKTIYMLLLQSILRYNGKVNLMLLNMIDVDASQIRSHP